MRRFGRVFLASVILAALSCTGGDRSGLAPLDNAPPIVGTDLAGSPLALSNLKGKVTLVNFWATWCGPCLQEIPELDALYSSLKDSGFQIVGVAVDDTLENIREAQARYKFSYPILVDTRGTTKRAYELKGFPESFVLDAEQRVLVVADPEDGSPVTKIIGPREWNSPRAQEIFSSLLKKQHSLGGAQ